MRDKVLLAAVAVIVATSGAAARESAVQCTSVGSQVLVNKDVGQDRWVITYRKSDGLTIGNVFTGEGGAVFVQCTRNGVSNGKLQLQCATADSCSADTCPDFQPLPDPVAIDCSFFAAPCSPVPVSTSFAGTCSGSPPRAPYTDETACAKFAASSGCSAHEFSPGSCAVSLCCSPVDCNAP